MDATPDFLIKLRSIMMCEDPTIIAWERGARTRAGARCPFHIYRPMPWRARLSRKEKVTRRDGEGRKLLERLYKTRPARETPFSRPK